MPRFEDTIEVWRVFEDLHTQGLVKALGISNIYDIDALKQLWSAARVKPSYVQNRFYAKTGFDIELRKFCKTNNVIYQSFWTLTANKRLLERFVRCTAISYILSLTSICFFSEEMHEISRRLSKTPSQVLFRFLIQEGVLPLTGTQSVEHMQQDIEAQDLTLPLWSLTNLEVRIINEVLTELAK
jgi:diketogulonate reductase-like aldo/keto reductase